MEIVSFKIIFSHLIVKNKISFFISLKKHTSFRPVEEWDEKMTFCLLCEALKKFFKTQTYIHVYKSNMLFIFLCFLIVHFLT